MGSDRGVLVVVVLALASACSNGVRVHQDGDGPLHWIGESSTVITQVGTQRPDADGWTFGHAICVENPFEPVTIVSVDPVEKLGGEFEVLTLIRDAPPSSQLAAGSGFPAEGLPGVTREAVGAVISTGCVDGAPPLGQVVPELWVALRPVGDQGGGWVGVAVTYRQGDKEYQLQFKSVFIICDAGVVDNCPEMLDGSELYKVWTGPRG